MKTTIYKYSVIIPAGAVPGEVIEVTLTSTNNGAYYLECKCDVNERNQLVEADYECGVHIYPAEQIVKYKNGIGLTSKMFKRGVLLVVGVILVVGVLLGVT